MTELEDKLIAVVAAAKYVIPTSEMCPLKVPLEDLFSYAEEIDSKTFDDRLEGKNTEYSSFVWHLLYIKDTAERVAKKGK